MCILYIGSDISQASFTSSVWDGQASQWLGEYPNERGGFEEMAQEVSGLQAAGGYEQIHLVLESTGGYEIPLLAFAYQQGWRYSLPNPKRVRDWAKGMGYRVKHDRIDSRILNEYGAKCEPAPQEPVPAAVEELDSLLQRQADLEKMRQQERNRAHAIAYRPQAAAAAVESIAQMINQLEVAHQQVAEAIETLLAANPALRVQAQRLLTVAGVGQKTVYPLLVFCHRFQARTAGQGTSKGITAYAGLDAQESSSGRSVWKRPKISKMGNAQLRARLYLAALGGTRAKDSPLRHFYMRLVGRNKPKKLALVAASRKILVWAWAVFQQEVDFDPSRCSVQPFHP